MARLRDPRARLSLGPRADLRDDRALHDRGSLRSRGCRSSAATRALRDELGDLLFQVVFHARIARGGAARSTSTTSSLRSATSWSGAIRTSSAMTRVDSGRADAAWEEQKARERAARGAARACSTACRSALPALTRAAKLGKRAARVGFDWPDARGRAREGARGARRARRRACAGDAGAGGARSSATCCSASAQVARHLGLDPEDRRCAAPTPKFERRFGGSRGSACGRGRRPPMSRPAELERYVRTRSGARLSDRELSVMRRRASRLGAADALRREPAGACAACRDRRRNRQLSGRHRERRDGQRQEHAAAEDLSRDRPRRRTGIGHTQPRRIAAQALASRIATELGTTVGELVGYQVRFVDRTGPQTLIKLMTDGVLLRELERDRLAAPLRHADHRRGARAQPQHRLPARRLPHAGGRSAPSCGSSSRPRRSRRARFAEFFGGAPVIEVEGRSYPVEVRYRPIDDDDESAVALAEARARGGRGACTMRAGSTGDVLVFLPGEKQIRRRRAAAARRAGARASVLPLYSRLSTSRAGADLRTACDAARRARHQRRRNLAHHSGRALRDRLGAGAHQPLQPARQAAAAADRADLAGQRRSAQGTLRPRRRRASASGFTPRPTSLSGPSTPEPEIQRTNLASLILQMAALGLGAPDRVPVHRSRRTRGCSTTVIGCCRSCVPSMASGASRASAARWRRCRSIRGSRAC